MHPLKIEIPNSEVHDAIAALARTKVVGVTAESHAAHVRVGHARTTIVFTPHETATPTTGEVEPPSLAARIMLLQIKQHEALSAGRFDEVQRLISEQRDTIAEAAGASAD